MLNISISFKCQSNLKQAVTSLKDAAISYRTAVVSEVFHKAPIVGQHLLDQLEVVSEALYAGTGKMGGFVRRVRKQVITFSVTSVQFLLTGLRALLAVLVENFSYLAPKCSAPNCSSTSYSARNSTSWVPLIVLAATGLLFRNPLFRTLFLAWRIYRLARRLARVSKQVHRSYKAA